MTEFDIMWPQCECCKSKLISSKLYVCQACYDRLMRIQVAALAVYNYHIGKTYIASIDGCFADLRKALEWKVT